MLVTIGERRSVNVPRRTTMSPGSRPSGTPQEMSRPRPASTSPTTMRTLPMRPAPARRPVAVQAGSPSAVHRPVVSSMPGKK